MRVIASGLGPTISRIVRLGNSAASAGSARTTGTASNAGHSQDDLAGVILLSY
jgi:hypothetical protein